MKTNTENPHTANGWRWSTTKLQEPERFQLLDRIRIKIMKNIGNSILPSSDARILQPIKFKAGSLVVVPDEAADTHHLVFDGVTLASHPNGYSCYALAKRMIEGGSTNVMAQADYIIRCGGKADLEAIKRQLQ